MERQNKLIVRYRPGDRFIHWVVAVSFILAGLGGLAMYHPMFVPLSALFGGGPWTRASHPWIGLVVFVFFAALAMRFCRDNKLTAGDRKWLAQIGDVVANHEERLPEVGRYNAGQKVLFWVMLVTLVLLLLSGLVMWYAYFALDFSLGMRRLGADVHAISAFVLIIGIIVHIYASFWVKGSVRSMTRGTVTPAWAKQHHAAWYREISKGGAA